MALIDRVREIISAENDDFFRDDTLVYYINKAIDSVVSYNVAKELNSVVSMRSLDDLRDDATLSSLTGTAVGDYFEVSISFPADLKKQLRLRYGESTNLRELSQQKMFHVEYGNAIPTATQGYYFVTGNGATVLLNEDPDDDIKLWYITEPAVITDATETITDLPKRLENAVLYKAAAMAVGQESVKDPEGNINYISQIAQQELEQNSY